MLSNLPVMRSAGARTLFFGTSLVTVAIALWADGSGPQVPGLTLIFRRLFIEFDYPGAVCALLTLIAAALVSRRVPFTPVLRWAGEHPRAIAATSALVLCLGTLLVYRDYPLAMDEYCPYFQSRIFASGHLAGQFPPALVDWLVPRGFQNWFLSVSHVTGRIASNYGPSFALILTPFTWLGIPWACNPIISGLTLLALHRLAQRLFASLEMAGLTVLLTVASPVFFANGISYYSMPAHLLANVVYTILLLEATASRAVLAGLVGSIALTLSNPVPHLLFALPWMFALIRRPGGVRMMGWLSVGYLPLCLLLGVGWAFFTSGLAHEGAAVAHAATTANADLARVSSAFALPSSVLLVARVIGMAKIWVWAVPGLVVLAVVGACRWRHDERCRALIVATLLTLVGFLFVPFDQGHGWGFRYFHSVWFVLPLFAAGALVQGPAPARGSSKTEPRWHTMFADPPTQTFVVACALFALVADDGLRAVQIHGFIAENMQQVPHYTDTGRQVVIIDPRWSFYGEDLIRNDPWLRGDVIRMTTHERAADESMMREQFPKMRCVYIDIFGSVWSSASERANRTRC
jgi:hypothetical protein